jgi:NAD(P)-dependent dehydrogenase (short-subunit alcohol dehydrogenase family)
VRALAQAGAQVAIDYKESAEAARALAEAVQNEGGQAEAFFGDAGDLDSLRGLLEAAGQRFSGLDILVNNVGPYTDAPFVKLAPEAWDWIVNTNVKAAYLAAQAVYPAMQARGWGRIVNISANSAFVRNHSVYGLAKNALLALTEALALEFSPHVTVNAIAPGLIDDAEVPEADKQMMLAGTPLRRLVTAPEVAHMVCLLCSPAFDSVTGQTIVMDGGQTIPRAAMPEA